MTANTVNGSRNGARSGAQTLVLLSTPLNVLILRALAAGPIQQTELRRAAGSPAQSTLRAQLKRLIEIGAIVRHRRNSFPGRLEYELTDAGQNLLDVLEVLECWLEQAPSGPLVLGSNAAKAAIRALAEGWSTTMLRALATGPLSLTELDGIITSLSYPSLERRLAAMRLAGLVEPQPGNGRGTPYAITDWQRLGIAPLIAAARWEGRDLAEQSAAIGRLEIETALLLVIPQLRLANDLAGSCRLAAEISTRGTRRLAGVMVDVGRGGTVTSCTTKVDRNADAWALGPSAAWLSAVVERDLDGLELGGDCSLSRSLVEGLHKVLFGTSVHPRP